MPSALHDPRYENFRSVLIKARKDADMTQTEIAEALGKPQSYVSKYEKGERRLDVIELIDISKVIGVDPSILITSITQEV